MSIEAMKLALEALELHGQQYPHMVKGYCLDAITALRQAIEQAQNKPDFEKAYLVWQDKTEWVQETAQPHELGMHRADVLKQRIEQAQRQPLTRGQIREIEIDVSLNQSFDYITPAEQLCRAIEAAHGIKGEA